ncbi:MAG: VOC family protein [Cypionkella sp.]
MKIHHLGIVTDDVDAALQALGLTRGAISETIYDPEQKNNLHFIHLQENDLWLELVEPMADDASTAKFARKFGMGLHHLAMGSADLAATEASYAGMPAAFTLGRYQLSVRSFGGKIRTLFIAVKGLIIEFVQPE